jgi:hypothetical protein
MVPLYASTLPLLHAGDLPTTAQAQRIKAWVDKGGDVAVFAGAASFAELSQRVRPSPGAYAADQRRRSGRPDVRRPG